MCEIKLCTELEWPDLKQSLQVALKENPENISNVLSFESLIKTRDIKDPLDEGIPPARIALSFDKKWRVGKKLKISFINVSPEIKLKIINKASEWLNYVNVKFVYIDDNDSSADIRITNELGDGSWSYIGTDALLINSKKATMNFGWLTESSSDEEYSRVVLHEFGHALGAIHEHQHPESAISWNKEAVYAYYERTNNWDKDQVEKNIFKKYARGQTQYSSYDKKSIMHYAIPRQLVIDEKDVVGWNTELSPLDKSSMRKFYPLSKADGIEVG
jgi:serralysin